MTVSRSASIPFPLQVRQNAVPGWRVVVGFGERESIGTTATGEDVWRGAATEVPTPDSAGEQMTVVSTDAADAPAGTGVRTVMVHYLDANGDEQDETVTLNGTTPVDLVASNVRFVNTFHAVVVGSNGVAEGDITIYKTGAAATVYNLIALGGNMNMVPHFMVPRGKTLVGVTWSATEAQGKRATFRIRSTDCHGELIPDTFIFKGVTYLNRTTSGLLTLEVQIPAFSILKVTVWAVILGSEGSCNWSGYLIDDA